MLSTATGTLRQRACSAGPDPSYWYPVEWDAKLGPEKVIGVKLWDIAVAVFRGRDGRIRAIEDRCAHRQVQLSNGFVEDCRLKCTYHGWTYGPDGQLVDIPHDRFGKAFPSVQLRTFPVEVRYGLIWVFFGDPSLASQRSIPHIPELDGPQPWACVQTDYSVRAHPSMIVNNAMDSTHVATLHSRRFRTRSLKLGPITRCEADGDRVLISHKVTMDPSALLWYVANKIKVEKQDTCYDYPHIWCAVGGVYWLWYFMLPVDVHTTRLFLLSLSERVKIPFTPLLAPKWLIRAFLPIATRLLIKPLFEEDVWSVEIEQQGFEQNGAMPSYDSHPTSNLCYQLTVRKWEEHLAAEEGRKL